MTHLIVNRVVIALCMLAIVSAAAFAWLVAREPAPLVAATAAGSSGMASAAAAPPSGAALFEQHCGRCHELAAVALVLRDAADPDAASAQVLDFLKEHGRATNVEDAAIVAWLRAVQPESQARRGPSP